MFYEGGKLWNEYVLLNGYSWETSKEGLKKLSRLLDLNVRHLEKLITFYLEQ
jgi:hypothetical protein